MIAFREIMYTFLIKNGLGIGQQVHHEEKSDETFVQKGIGISLTFGKLSSKA
jgi:hypothetical protein